MDETLQTILSLVLAGGGLASLITALVARRKAPSEVNINLAEAEKKEAETTEIITRAAGAAASLLEQQLGKLRAENESLRCEVRNLTSVNEAMREVQHRHEQEIGELQKICEQFDELLGGAHVLYDQVIELNGKPKYKPPERRRKQ